MKKVIAIAIVLVLSLSLFTACGNKAPDTGNGGGSNGEVYTLKLHSHDPEASPTGDFLKAWAKDVMDASNNRIKIDIYHGATLGGPRDTLDMIANGTCDIGWGLQSFFPGVFPASEVLMLPMTGIKTAKQASAVMWDLYEKVPAIKEEYSKYKVLLLHANCQSPISSKKKQFSSVDDFVGLNIRGNAGPPTDFIKALKASPVSITIGELFEAINNGTIDAVITDWNALNCFQLYQTCKYYLDADIGVSNYFMLMNWDSYNKLPDDLKKILDEHSGKAALEYCGNYWDESAAEVRKLIQEKGDVIYKFNDAEQKKLQAIADKVTKDWIASKTAAGLPAQEIYDTMMESIKTHAEK